MLEGINEQLAPGTGATIATHKPSKRFRNAAKHARRAGESVKSLARNPPLDLESDAADWLRHKGQR
jgi:hypothetical protein